MVIKLSEFKSRKLVNIPYFKNSIYLGVSKCLMILFRLLSLLYNKEKFNGCPKNIDLYYIFKNFFYEKNKF